MPNMAYCRFQNTLLDLQDCHRALDGMGDYTAELDNAWQSFTPRWHRSLPTKARRGAGIR